MWHYETTDGKSIQKCVEWLLPYLKKEEKWTYKQIKEMTYDNTIKVLKLAATAYAKPAYDALAKKTDAVIYQSDMCQLTF